MRCNFAVCLALVVLSTAALSQQGVQANAEPTYQALRRISIGTDTASVTNFVLKRDVGTFTFKSGTFYLLAPVAGKVTGAVFVGEGEFTLMPPIPAECRTLSLFTKDPKPGITESFTTVVLRFTDDTAEQIKKAASGSISGSTSKDASDALNGSQDDTRKKLGWNISARILQDVLSSEPGGFFAAFIHGKKYDGHELFVIDPHGAPFVAPEEVVFRSYSDTKWGRWAAFHFTPEYASGTARGTEQNAAFAIERQNLDTKIDKGGMLHGNAATTVMSGVSGLRAVGFDLFPTLRVQKVTDDAGTALAFIQEDKKDDPDFWVILPKALSPGEKFTIHTIYEGKDAIRNEGAGNYYPVARDNWYPSTGFGQYSSYEMRFSVPKNVTLVSTGDLVSQKVEGDQNVSVWKSAIPQAVAGFNLGEFKRTEAKLQKSGYLIEAYANKQAPDDVRAIQQIAEGDLPGQMNQRTSGLALGTMSTTSLMDKPLAEAQLSVGLYNDYFGAIPYKRISMTQQTACDFGQSWPSLVYMPICSFFDATVRHQLGLDDVRGYWKSVAAHEVAHQWWGQAVGFSSYRDQWMSEGFAEFSASLYLQLIQKNQKEFVRWWDDQRELLTERNKEGFRAIDVGPLTAGYRLANTRSGFDIPRRLIYPKGGYVLHMIRMMMWEPKAGDEKFRALMQEFVRTYSNQPASTEDFKAMVEKHMTPAMDLDGNGKMDWFFNEYVYGTELPTYKLEASFTPGENTVFLNLKLTQSNVSPEFRMPVPLYLELADGRILRLGSAPLRGNTTIDQKIPLNGLKAVPKRAMVNYFDDVLSIVQ